MAIKERRWNFKRCFSFRKVSFSLSAEAIPEKILPNLQQEEPRCPITHIPCAKCKVTSHLHATSRSAFCKQRETYMIAAAITKLIASSIRKVAEEYRINCCFTVKWFKTKKKLLHFSESNHHHCTAVGKASITLGCVRRSFISHSWSHLLTPVSTCKILVKGMCLIVSAALQERCKPTKDRDFSS